MDGENIFTKLAAKMELRKINVHFRSSTGSEF